MDDIVRTASPVDARRLFLDRGAVPDGAISQLIVRSWMRCREMGLDLAARPHIESLSDAEVRHITERNERLARAARPEITALRREAAATGGVVLLTDAQGLIMEGAGAEAFQRKAARVALRPGVSWNESCLGTNAIGTAIAEGRDVEVRGAEHFFEPHAFLTCAAMPILGPTGEMLGVLDLSGRVQAGNHHALGLVRMAVSQIEHRLFAGAFEHQEVLRLHGDPDILGTHQEGILVFEGERLVAANRHALGLLDLGWGDLGMVGKDGLLVHERRRDDRVRDRRGNLLHVRRDPEKRYLGRGGLPPSSRRMDGVDTAGDGAIYLSAEVRMGLEKARRLLDANVPILLQGETGTGKEVFARRLHALSARAGKPFVAVNCAALPESLIESELFGYEDGAFTGARRKGSLGLLREADGGVLFLDEIGDMPLEQQARLLRVIQDREVTPLGGGRRVPIDIALICASHRSLKGMVKDGAFRDDLYFRVAQFTVDLPSLRDLPDRARMIRALWDSIGGSTGAILDDASVARLAGHHWPGNFRQLVSTLKILAALTEPGESVTPDRLPDGLESGGTAETASAGAPLPMTLVETLRDHDRDLMQSTLEACGGNVSMAARRLGVHRSTLYRRLDLGRGGGVTEQ